MVNTFVAGLPAVPAGMGRYKEALFSQFSSFTYTSNPDLLIIVRRTMEWFAGPGTHWTSGGGLLVWVALGEAVKVAVGGAGVLVSVGAGVSVGGTGVFV